MQKLHAMGIMIDINKDHSQEYKMMDVKYKELKTMKLWLKTKMSRATLSC